jgi:predicted RecB family nuclease
MTSRPLKYNTTVIYEGQIAIIKSISKMDTVNIKFLYDKNNAPITVKKKNLKTLPHDEGELIKYKNTYYIISKIILENKKPYYNLNFVNKKDIVKKIESNDISIITIDKKEQEITISFLKFIDRYNSSISFHFFF